MLSPLLSPILPSLSAWQELALVGLALLTSIYVFYFKIWLIFALGSDLLFVVALALTGASIATPALFDVAAHKIVDQSPLPDALSGADRRVAKIAALPQELIDDLLAKIGYEVDEEPQKSDQEIVTPAAEDEVLTATDALTALTQGPFTETIRPTVDSLVAVVLRGAALMGGTFLMLTALAMRSSSTTAQRLRDITARLEALEGGGG